MAGPKGSKNILFKHGLKKSPVYLTWCNIKQRCYNINNEAYLNYGGRGITICDEWKNEFKAFHDWSFENGYSKGLSIDRIDNDKGYSPDNCRYVTRITQGRNQRTRKNSVSGFKGVTLRKRKKGDCYLSLITVDGKTVNLGQFNTAIEGWQARVNYVKENNLTDFIL